jgi:hypothetical protein
VAEKRGMITIYCANYSDCGCLLCVATSERDDALCALEMERAAHRATADRLKEALNERE